MSSFSAILSSIGSKPQPKQQSSSNPKPAQANSDGRKLTNNTNGVNLKPNNAAAGVKRRSEEPEAGPKAKVVKSEQDNVNNRPALAAPSNRFQLTAKGAAPSRPGGVPQKPLSRPTSSSGQQRPPQNSLSKPTLKPGTSNAPTASSPANGTPPAKRGFASIMERAKAAQEVAKATGSSGIKHKAVEKVSRKERLRMMEEAKAEQQKAKRRKQTGSDRSRSNTPVTTKAGPPETTFKGTMKEKKKAEPLSYKGTMRAVAPGAKPEKAKTKGQGQDKYSGYASWSDLSDAEDEEQDYDSEGSSDMEGGYDDMEREEQLALRAAKKEDQEALEEEEAHRKEKLDRKKRLEALSKSAAAKKRY